MAMKNLLLMLIVSLVSHRAFGATPRNIKVLTFFGYAMRNGSIVKYDSKCHDRYACQYFTSNVCFSVGESLKLVKSSFYPYVQCNISKSDKAGDLVVDLVIQKAQPGWYDGLALRSIFGPSMVGSGPDKFYFGRAVETSSYGVVKYSIPLLDGRRMRIEIIGRPLRDGMFIRYSDECAKETSGRCFTFKNWLCNRTADALWSDTAFKRLYPSCVIKKAELPDHVEVYIIPMGWNIDFAVDRTILFSFIPMAGVPEQYGVPYLSSIRSINFNVLRVKNIPIETRPRMIIEGAVFNKDTVFTYPEKCGAVFNAECAQFQYTVCKSIQRAFQSNINTQEIFLSCKIERTTGRLTKATIFLREKHPREVRFHTLQKIFKGQSWPKPWFYLGTVDNAESADIKIRYK